MFTDESRFNLSFADGRIRVFRRRGERFADKCLLERGRFGGGSVMVRGGIMGGRKTDLIVIPGILNANVTSCCYPVSEPESWYPDA